MILDCKALQLRHTPLGGGEGRARCHRVRMGVGVGVEMGWR